MNDNISRLTAEYEEARALLDKKSKEAKGLVDGLEKYKNDKVMFAQLKQLVISKYNEIKELNARFASIENRVKKETARLEAAAIKKSEPRLEKPNSISVSSACEKVLTKVMEEKAEPKPALQEKAVEVKKETVVKEVRKEKKEKKLNDIAISEASTQEKFLKSQAKNLKSYGQA